MGKKKKNSNPKGPSKKNSNIQSNSLVPARSSGEKPHMAFRIKTEEDTDMQPTDTATNYNATETNVNEIFSFNNDTDMQPTDAATDSNVRKTSPSEICSFLEAYKNNSQIYPESSECSNHSTATELMEMDQGAADFPYSQNCAQNHTVPFTDIRVKQEPTDPGHPDNPMLKGFTPFMNTVTKSHMLQDSSVQETVLNNSKESSSVNPTVINSFVKSEPPDEIPQSVTHEKSEKNSNQGEGQLKRKNDFAESLEEIRKRLKVEPVDDSENVSDSSNGNQVDLQNNGIHEENFTTPMIKTENAGEEGNSDNEDIAVLPVPTVEKNVPLITISDEDDDESHDEDMETNQNSSFAKPHKEKDFSTDILKIFSVASELDRNDCKSALDYVLKNKTKNNTTFNELFPIVKKENEKPREIKVGDILFKRSMIETDLDAECSSASPRVHCNILNGEICQPTAQPAATNYVNLSAPSTSSSTAFPLQLPSLPSTPSFNVNPTQSPPFPSTLNSNVEESGCPLTFEQMKEALNIIKLSVGNTMPAIGNSSVAAPKHCQWPSQDPGFQKRLGVESESRIQVSNTQPTVEPSKYLPAPIMTQSAAFSLQSPTPLATQSFNVHLPGPIITQAAALPLQSPSPLATPSFNVNSAGNPQPAEKLSNHEFPNLALNNTSSLSASVPAPMPSIRDPRLAHKQDKFAPRKGVKDLHHLYRKIGKEDVTAHLKTLILQWNPSWITTQLKTGKCPPICDSYPTVKYFYPNKMSFYNTYLPLHLLNVWFTLFNRWTNGQWINLKCTVQSIERKDNEITYSCSCEMDNSCVWPKGDDIVLCKYKDEEAFLLVTEVKKKPTNKETKMKLRIFLDTCHNLKLRAGDIMEIYILLNIRMTYLEVKALTMLCDNLQDLVLRPQFFKDSVKIVVLDQSKHIKGHRDEVLDMAFLNHVRVMVIVTDEYTLNNQLDKVQVFITMIAYAMVYNEKYQVLQERHSKVLILLKNDELLMQLYRRLKEYNPVLAIRVKQFNLSDEFVSVTLEDQLERNGNLTDIFNKHNIFLSTFSAFGTAEQNHLSKHNNWNCIVYDAHICTEVETAVPMTLKINKLFLMGNRNNSIPLPSPLQDLNYHFTFFDRLLK